MTDYGAVLVILLLNTAVALIVFAVGLFQERGRRGTLFLFAWFILICPLAAAIFTVIGKVLSAILKTKNIDMDDISFSKQREKVLLPPDSDIEMNFVPLGDAMAVTDTGDLRRLLIDILKNNDQAMLTGVSGAINNSDTEVSHYAATAILDILSEFRETLQSLRDKVKRYPDDVSLNQNALEYVCRMLNMNIMNESERRSTVYAANEIAESLFANNLWYMKGTYYLWLTDLLLSVQDYALAENWAARARKYCSDQLSSYKARLHLYYAQKRTDAFFACIAELKNSDLAVDKEILDLFRIYG